jgi:hypothetical protein
MVNAGFLVPAKALRAQSPQRDSSLAWLLVDFALVYFRLLSSK